MKNRDERTIRHFGREWSNFSFLDKPSLHAPLQQQFEDYCAPLPSGFLSSNSLIAGDFGAGSGRWSEFLVNSCKKLYVVEPGKGAVTVLRKRFRSDSRIQILEGAIGEVSIPTGELDLAISIGVLHHIPRPQDALVEISSYLKNGGVFLGYVYYNLENRSLIYKFCFQLSNLARFFISRLPHRIKRVVITPIAYGLYYPLSRFSGFIERFGFSSQRIPLHQYAHLPLYFLLTDAFDRLGTPLEARFSKAEITKMLVEAGFDDESIKFSDKEPFYCFSAIKKSNLNISQRH